MKFDRESGGVSRQSSGCRVTKDRHYFAQAFDNSEAKVDEVPKPNPVSEGIRWASAITTCAVEIVLPSAAGYWLDTKLGTLPWFTVVGLLLGLFSGTYHLVVLLRKTTKSKHEE